MALGSTTYKTPNAINRIGSDLTGKEGCGVTIVVQGGVGLATKFDTTPYGIITVGGKSVDDTYPPGGDGIIAQSSLELVDQLGCVVQVTVSATGNVYVGEWLQIDGNVGDGTFCSVGNGDATISNWVWGLCLTEAAPGEQAVMRFQPYAIYSTYVPTPSP